MTKSAFDDKQKEEIIRSILLGDMTVLKWGKKLEGKVKAQAIQAWVNDYYKKNQEEINEKGGYIKNKEFKKMIGKEYLENPQSIKVMARKYKVSPFTIKQSAKYYETLLKEGRLDEKSPGEIEYRPITEKERKKAVGLYENGASTSEIAITLNLNYSVVYSALKDYKAFKNKIENGKKPFTDRYIRKMINSYRKSGQDKYEFAEKQMVTYYGLDYIEEKYGKLFELQENHVPERKVREVLECSETTDSELEIAEKTGVNPNAVFKILT